MNSRERVLRALLRDGLPDRVPLQFDLSRDLLEKFSRKYGVPVHYTTSWFEDVTYRISGNELRMAMGSDCVIVGASLPRNYTHPLDNDGCITNEFGMKMRQGALYMELVGNPLAYAADPRQIEDFPFPDPLADGRYDDAARIHCAIQGQLYYHRRHRIDDLCARAPLGRNGKAADGHGAGAAYVESLSGQVHGLYARDGQAARRVGGGWRFGPGTTLAGKTGCSYHREMWRRYFKERYRHLYAELKAVNPQVLIMQHSDGAIAPILDDWIEVGMEVFNPVQPGVPGHDPVELKRRFGDRLSFWGAIDQQNLLPFGSPEEIEADVKSKIDVLGRGGGYMIAPAHIIQADTPMENVEAFVEAARRHGRYEESKMTTTKPNIMIIMTDQQRADISGAQGFGLDTMPFLESLRGNGVWFRSAYTSTPICIPAWVSMFTGRYAKAHGIIANLAEPDSALWARSDFGAARPRVRTGAVWQEPFTRRSGCLRRQATVRSHRRRAASERASEDVAFDQWMTQARSLGLANCYTISGGGPIPVPYRIRRNRLVGPEKGRSMVRLGEHSGAAQPLPSARAVFRSIPAGSNSCSVGGPEILRHKNYQWQYQYEAIKHYHPECDQIWRRYRANYCGMLRLIDDQMERLVSKLTANDMLSDTIVLYLSDHGEFCGEYGLYRKGLASARMLCAYSHVLVRRAVHAYSGFHPAFVSITDVFPTVCEAVGAEIPEGVQGRSLLPLLTGQPYSKREFSSAYVEHGVGGRSLQENDHMEFGDPADTVYIDGVARTNFDGTRVAMSGFRRAVVKGKWKLVYDLDYPLEMYDLEIDPHELKNVAARSGSRRGAPRVVG